VGKSRSGPRELWFVALLSLGCSNRVVDSPRDAGVGGGASVDSSVADGSSASGGSTGGDGGFPPSLGGSGGSGGATCSADCDAAHCPPMQLPDPRDRAVCKNYLGIGLNHGFLPPSYTIGCGRILVTDFGPLSIQTTYWYDLRTGAFLGEKSSAANGPYPACQGVPQPDCPSARTCTNCDFHNDLVEGGVSFRAQCTLADGTVVPWETDGGAE